MSKCDKIQERLDRLKNGSKKHDRRRERLEKILAECKESEE